MHRGWVKIHRKLFDNPCWLDEPFTRGQAWVDLILLANHRDSHIRKRGIKIPVLRGQVGWSQRALSERWKWSRGKVIRFLDELEAGQQIVPQKNNVSGLITIVNYGLYQQDSTTDDTTNSTTDGPQTGHKQYQNKNDKNDKNEKNEDLGDKPPASVPSKKRFIPPSPEEVDAYCQERNNGISGQEFCDSNQAKGWVIGKTGMKDWKAAVRTWENTRKRNAGALGRTSEPVRIDSVAATKAQLEKQMMAYRD